MPEYHNIPATPEAMLETARIMQEEGYEEIAELYVSLSSHFAMFNEHHDQTAEWVRQKLGNQKFWEQVVRASG